MLLRVIDMEVFLQAGPGQPNGVSLIELPADWPIQAPSWRQQWVDAKVDEIVPEGNRRAWELAEVDENGEVIWSSHSMEG